MRSPPAGRAVLALFLALLLTLVLSLAEARPALAHAVVVRTEPPDLCLDGKPAGTDCDHGTTLPAPPPSVQIVLDEGVQPFGDGIRVIGPDGNRVDRGPARADGAVMSVAIDARQEGTYLVHWQVVAPDTHPTVGHFAFSVGHPSTVVGVEGSGATGAPLGMILQVASRWLHFVGFALTFGVLMVRFWVGSSDLYPTSPRSGAPASDPFSSLWPLVNQGIFLLLVAEPVALLGQTAILGPRAALDPDVVSAALDSSFGRAMGLRLGAALALWVILGVAREGSRKTIGAGLLAGGLLAFVDGFAAHAVEARPLWLGLLANAAHVAAMGAWLGALVALALLSRQAGGFRAAGEAAKLLRPLAVGPITLLGLSGVILAAQHLPQASDLIRTTYGATLLVKTMLVALAAALGLAAIKPGSKRARELRRAETAVVLGVIGLAALLVSLPPPR